MSEEVLWYISRISGLMSWILSFGALAAGLLARSAPRHGTSAGLWAADTRNLLGRLSIVALLVHAAATATADRFGLTLGSALTGRAGGQWLVAAAVIGVASGWAMIAVELVRLVLKRLSPGGDLILLAVAAAIVGGGGYHGWQLGSDTQNPLAIAVMVLSGLLLLGAAALGLTSFLDGQDPLTAAPPSIAAEGQSENLVLGSDAAGSGQDGPQHFDPGPSVSLSRTISPAEDELGGRSNVDAYRGPQISSARDVSGSAATPPTGTDSDQTPGAWSMRKLPDAPKPAHRSHQET